MRYAGLIQNDTTAGNGICVSLYTQGCPHHCIGCHNPETWKYNDGKEFTQETIDLIIQSLNKNGIHRDLCILGGEPLINRNINMLKSLLEQAKAKYPDIKIYVWTGYTWEELMQNQPVKQIILPLIDVLIDGRFILKKRDITLHMRGSDNQRVINVQKSLNLNRIILYKE